MKELWRSLMDDRTMAVRVIRAVAMGGVLYFLIGPESFKEWAIQALGVSAMFLGAGEKNDS